MRSRHRPSPVTTRKASEIPAAELERLKAVTDPRKPTLPSESHTSSAVSTTDPLLHGTKPKTMRDFFIERGFYKIVRTPSGKSVEVMIDGNLCHVNFRAHWESEKDKKDAVRFLVEEVLKDKDRRDIDDQDFRSNMLGGLIVRYFRSSPYEAMKAANCNVINGFEFNEWEMAHTPNNFYALESNRTKAIKWLVEQLAMDEGNPEKRVKGVKKDPRTIEEQDFRLNRLGGLLVQYYGTSPFRALKEGGCNMVNGFEFNEWEMSHTPVYFYNDKNNRVKAVVWLVEQLSLPEVDPRKRVKGEKNSLNSITTDDFIANGLDGLGDRYHQSPPLALFEAGLIDRKTLGEQVVVIDKNNPKGMEKFFMDKGWCIEGNDYGLEKNELIFLRADWEKEEVRTEAIKFLVDSVLKGKDRRDVSAEDFQSNLLTGLLLSHYNNSPFVALKEAGCNIINGFKFNEWEMAFTPTGFYNDESKRVLAIEWLVKQLAMDNGDPEKRVTGVTKDPRDIGKDHFESNRLRGVMPYYDNSPFKILKAAKCNMVNGFEFNEWEMAHTPNNFYALESNRTKAIKWLVEQLAMDEGNPEKRVKGVKKDPEAIIGDDFEGNGLRGVMGYYRPFPRAALVEAGLLAA